MAMQVGSVVWLKSGGPSMTIKGENNAGNVICTWFIDKEVKEHAFGSEQLTDVNPNPKKAMMA